MRLARRLRFRREVTLFVWVVLVGGGFVPALLAQPGSESGLPAQPPDLITTEDDARIPPDAPPLPEAVISGDVRINAIANGYKWSTPTVTYSFYSTSVFGGQYYGTETGVREVSDAVKQNIRTIMAWYNTLLNVQFVEVAETPTTIGQIRIMLSDGAGYAYAYFPTTASMFNLAGDIHLMPSYDRLGDTNGFQHTAGQHGYATLIHEIGHAIGLKHPHSSTPNLPADEDNNSHTVMSYNFLGASPATPMGYDLLALQFLYGARTHRAGNDVYQFTHGELDQYALGGQSYISPSITTQQAIWDSGGYNVFDLSSVAANPSGYRVDLKPLGSVSTIGWSFPTYFYAGVSIGPGVHIHKLINSSRADVVYANADANVFAGYAPGRATGADVIFDADSADTIDLSGYSPSQVTQTPAGADLLIGLGVNGSITVKNYYAGNRPGILLNGAAPRISIGNASVAEGSTGTTVAAFAVTLSPAAGSSVSVSYTTSSGTATAGVDYIATSGTLTFAPGETTRTVQVLVVGDAAVEGDETFSVLLSAPTAGIEIGDPQGDATIINDDTAVNQPPQAVLSGSPLSGTTPLPVTFSSTGSRDPDGAIVAYAWAFGDGATSSAEHPAHTYTTAGSFTVNLRVTDDKGATDTKSLTVTAVAPVNQPPVAAITATVTTGTAPLTVSFSSAGSLDPDGTIASYVWTFGDGTTSSVANPVHVFSTVGTFTVTLTVADDKGASASRSIGITTVAPPVNQPPVAQVSASVTSGVAPLAVGFFSTGSRDPDGSVASYAWTFGDGTTSAAPNPAHTYAAAGTFTVTLTVTDNQGASGVATLIVTVSPPENRRPVAMASATTTNGTAPLAAGFSSAGSTDPDGTIVSFRWSFGDGGVSSTAYPTHVFLTPGTYTVTLTVTDDKGLSDSRSLTVTAVLPAVNKLPVAMITATPTTGTLPLTVTFSSAGSIDPDGVIVSYIWNFGGGGALSATDAIWTYATAGAFTATLTVTDDKGAKDTKSVTITVTAPAVNRPPSAHIAATPMTGSAPLTVNFSAAGSTDSDGTIASYAWNFSEGPPSSAVQVSHTYTVAGVYTVALIVTDNKGVTDTKTVTITVTEPTVNMPPTAQIAATPVTGSAPLTVNFSAGGSADSDGTIAAYAWNFGDGGTSSTAQVSHTYTVAGVYAVALIVTDDKGATDTKSVTITVTAPAVNVPPSAQIDATPITGSAPLTVNFSAGGSTDSDGTIASYGWNLGDGATSSTVQVSHTYTVAGVYTAVLIVTDDKGATDTKTVVITVQEPPNRPPVAVASATLLTGTAPLRVEFSSTGSADSDGTIASYAWTFGNGATSIEVNPTQTYTAAGTYVATLIVTDDRGASDSRSLTITVVAPVPPPVPTTPIMSVSDVAVNIETYISAWVGKAYVLVVDADGAPVPNATVTGRWFGMITGPAVSASTDEYGRATFTSRFIFELGSLGFGVVDVTHAAMVYDPSKNLKTTGTYK